MTKEQEHAALSILKFALRSASMELEDFYTEENIEKSLPEHDEVVTLIRHCEELIARLDREARLSE